jgi:hypothetical protein
MSKILTGVQSTGTPHLGNLLGAIIPAIELSKNPDNEVANLDDVKARLREAYELLISEASGATIRVFGYGKLFQRKDGQDCEAFGMGKAEADLLDDGYFGLINDASAEIVAQVKASVLKELSIDVDIEFIDVSSYPTVGSCQTNDEDSLHLRGWDTCFPLPFTPISYHPTQLGYDQYYNALCNIGR